MSKSKILMGFVLSALILTSNTGNFAQKRNGRLSGLMNPDRNNLSSASSLPDNVDVKSGMNVKWSTALGSQSYPEPVIVNGKVFIGTNNEGLKDPSFKGDAGVMMAFDKQSGAFLWQLAFEKRPQGRVNDWPLQGIRSAPYVKGDRMYFLNNRTELVCADTEGFLDKEDDGIKDSKQGVSDGDIVWKIDMMEELDVFPHNGTVSGGMNRPLVVGDLVITGTNNGVDEDHITLPSPFSPDIIALNKNTGKLVWEANLARTKNLHISASSPAYGVAGGKPQLIFPAGDGWVYSLDPKTGKEIWKFDANPKDSVWNLGGAGTRNNIIATPVIWDEKVYIAVGQDAEHGEGIGHLWAIDMKLTGDVTAKAVVWHRGGKDFNRTVSSVVIAEDILYAADLTGYVYALDAKTGEFHWKYDAFAAIWAGPLVADGKVYIGDEDGDLAILNAGKEMKVLGEPNLGAAIYSTSVADGSTLYVNSRNRLYAFGK